MKRFAMVLVALLAALSGVVHGRLVTDSAGRQVEIPDRVDRVFAAGPPASILIYVLRPDVLTGWPRALREAERPYVAPDYRDLPETGRLTGRGGEANLERVIAARPDVIIDFGSIGDTYVDLADRVQAQTGIPYLLIDGRLRHTPGALRLVAGVLGVESRGELLARDIEDTFHRLEKMLADVADAQRPSVFMARGRDGLETGVLGSINTEIIEWAGGRNVIRGQFGQRGLVRTSVEHVIAANPDTIITWDPGFFSDVLRKPEWQAIDAVKNRRIFLSPMLPFGWIDRPPSLNRIIGLRWLAGLFHPDKWREDLPAITRRFYSLYYHVDLDNASLARLIRWSLEYPVE